MRTRTRWLFGGIVLVSIVGTLLAVAFAPNEKHIERRIQRLYGTSDEQFVRAMGTLLGPLVLEGNRAEVLLNGAQIFPAMLEAIRGAQRTITFETYIYWSGDVGAKFAAALAERARAGVKVHLLLDWLGSTKMDEEELAAMQQAGVQVEKYHPLKWYDLSRVNNCTHRKLLVVDGRIGFTGGVGIADKWDGNAQDPDHWRDSHFRFEGPAVAQIQATFLDNWMKVRGEVLHGADYFPRLAPAGEQRAHVFSSSPSGGSESMHLMYLMSITSAERSIDIANSYFVPDELTVRALVEAMRRGVRVRIIVPGELIDTETVRRASRAGWGPLLEAGAEIYEFQPTMFHCKVMVVDNLLASVGSTNFDSRSFRLNDEANLNVYDGSFARRQTEIFEEDMKRSHKISYEAWRDRPWRDKLWEHAAALLSDQL